MITDIRGYGLFAGIDLEPMGNPGVRGLDFQKRMFKNGLHLKMTGDAALISPPLIAERHHICFLDDPIENFCNSGWISNFFLVTDQVLEDRHLLDFLEPALTNSFVSCLRGHK